MRSIKNIKCPRYRRVGAWYASKTNACRCLSCSLHAAREHGIWWSSWVTIYPILTVLSYFWIGSVDHQFCFLSLLFCFVLFFCFFFFCSVLEITERLCKSRKWNYVVLKFQHFALPGVVTWSGFLHADVWEVFKQIFSRPLSYWTSPLIFEFISGKLTTYLKTKITFVLLVPGRWVSFTFHVVSHREWIC